MIRKIHKLLIAAIVLAAPSCITDDFGKDDTGVPQDGDAVLLHLKTPGKFATPKTRALDYAKENTIADVHVLVFDTSNNLVDIKQAEDVDDKTAGTGAMTTPSNGVSGGATFSVPLSQIDDGNQYRLVVLANAATILDECGFIDPGDDEFESAYIGDSYADVTAALSGSFAAPLYTDGTGTIPMWGETAQSVRITPSVAIPAISMKRALARIDVGVGKYTASTNSWDGKKGSDVIPFALKSVYVMMPNSRIAPIPDPGKASGVPTPAGTKYGVLTASNVFNYPVTNDRSITYGIYVPEANVKMGDTKPGGETNHTSRMAVVVGGDYNNSGTTTYYRLDFAEADDDLVDVLRNHLYRFTVTDVEGAGYPTPEEAYAALPMNISSETEVEEEEGMTGVIFDGHYTLSVSEMFVQPEARYAGTTTLTVRTDYPGGWKAAVYFGNYGLNGSSTLGRGWLKISDDDDPHDVLGPGDPSDDAYVVAGPGDDDRHDITLHYVQNRQNIITPMWIRVTAGRMVLAVKVIRKPNAPLAAPGVIGYYFDEIDNEYKLTLAGSKEYGFPGSPLLSDPNDPRSNTLATGEPLSVHTVYVAHFKWASLIAIASHGYGGSSTTPFMAEDIVAGPTDAGYNLEALKANTALETPGFDAWALVPYRDDVDAYNNSWGYTAATGSADTGTDGIGDPCDYYFGRRNGTRPANTAWRLPHSPRAGGWHTGNFGSGSNDLSTGDWVMPNGARYIDNNLEEYKSFPTIGAVGGDGTGNPDWAMFLPFAGHRSTTYTSLVDTNARAYYWSDEASQYLYGVEMMITDHTVSNRIQGGFDTANAIRCVR